MNKKRNSKKLWIPILVALIIIVGLGIFAFTHTTRLSAEFGSANARYKLGLEYYQKKNYSQAKSWLEKSVNHKNSDAENTLGVMYLNALGVTKDEKKAVSYFQKSANQGNKYAEDHLGTAYYFGQGVAKDYALALKWLTKSANRGIANSQNVLATMYLYGQGVGKDKEKAIALYQKAAAQGNTYAQNHLNELQAVTNN